MQGARWVGRGPRCEIMMLEKSRLQEATAFEARQKRKTWWITLLSFNGRKHYAVLREKLWFVLSQNYIVSLYI